MWWILGGGIAVMIIITLYFTVRGGSMKANDWENTDDDREGN